MISEKRNLEVLPDPVKRFGRRYYGGIKMRCGKLQL